MFVSTGRVAVASLCLFSATSRDLPASASSFAASWLVRFPFLADTKHIASSHASLQHMQGPNSLQSLSNYMVASQQAMGGGMGPRISLKVERLLGAEDYSFSRALTSPAVEEKEVRLSDASAPPAARCPPPSFSPSLPPSTSASSSDPSLRSAAAHDAGFDSLLTCTLFLTQLDHILRERMLSWEQLSVRGTPGDGRVGILQLLGDSLNTIRLVNSQPSAFQLRSATPAAKAHGNDNNHSDYRHLHDDHSLGRT
eukprot:GHVT01011406.1.p1 GENE.GHVT01011406.1~~GHVT01011406.1.p1  ORF type:complete len:254 (-),score=68.78 GHVT01011406.1:589-1350(-)